MTNPGRIVKLLPFLLATFCCTLTARSIEPGIRQNPAEYDVLFYHLKLNISDTSTYISGSTVVTVKTLSGSFESFSLNFSSKLHTDSVTLDNRRVNFLHDNDTLKVLAGQLPIDTSVSIEVFYHGLGKNYSTSGIYNQFSTLWNRNLTWTLSEPFSAFEWFPCKQSLTDKADYVYVFLSTDNSLKAGSNGLLTAEVPLPDNRVRYEWKSKYPIDYYLISFTVSDFTDYSFYATLRNGDSVLVQNYIFSDNNYLEDNKYNIDKSEDLLALYSDLLGTYPFADEKYGHCLSPFSGGMEHQTMTTLIDFSFLLVAHEMFHQWFGDYVTCSSWQDIWINEGFASYGEYLADQYLVSQSEADRWINNTNQYVKSVPGGSVFIPENQAGSENRIFNGRLSYKKGASIIHMIRQETGNDSVFFDALRTFLDKYKFGTASGEDLKNHLNEKTGKDFTQFFNQWYYGEGYPIHSIRWDYRNDTLYISSLQTTSTTKTSYFDVKLDFRAIQDQGDTLISFRQTAAFNEWQVYLPGNVTSLQADPYHWLLIDVSDISVLPEIMTQTGFTIVPNPARYKVTVKLNSPPVENYTIYLASSEGRIMMSRESSSQTEEININQYPSGIYFVIIKNGKKTGQL